MQEPRIEREGWIAIALGAGAAVLAMALPFASFVLSYFAILVHEMGHALAGWLYGYPSIPAFDFAYGGGVTGHGARLVWIAAAVQILLLAALWIFRRNRLSAVACLCAAALYAATAWTPLHHAVITAMGHGFELVIAALFLHRAFSGSACNALGERPLYAFVGFFTVLHDLRFSWRLLTSPFERELYQSAKGGGHWMDFSRLAEETFHVSLESVAFVFLLLCLTPPLLALAVNVWRPSVTELALRLRRIE